jgi:hypothetical protein
MILHFFDVNQLLEILVMFLEWLQTCRARLCPGSLIGRAQTSSAITLLMEAQPAFWARCSVGASTSPAATELEMIVLDWLGKLLQLPNEFLSSGKQLPFKSCPLISTCSHVNTLQL